MKDNFDKIKKEVQKLGKFINETLKKASGKNALTEQKENYSPKEKSVLDKIRPSDVDYREKSNRLQIENFIFHFIQYLKELGWKSQEIVAFLKKFMTKANLNKSWDDLVEKIIRWAGFENQNK